jgi:protein TonB
VVRKSEPPPTRQESITQAPGATRPAAQTPPEQPGPEQKIREPEVQAETNPVPAEQTGSLAPDSFGAGNGQPETSEFQTGAAAEMHGPGAKNQAGAAGAGALGKGGPGTGGNGSGSSGTAGSLIKFGAPGGPGIVRLALPRYPSEARRLGKEGVVILKLSLDEAGTVYEVEILQGAGFGMDEASREAVLHSRFRPASSKGRSVPSQAILPIRFKLR